MRKLHKIGEFYTRIIMRNVGIFIFVGLLSVVFNDHGWIPNKNMYAISQLVYEMVMPCLIAYESGRAICEKGGGPLAVLAISGILVFDAPVGILAAMTLGPLAGLVWKYEEPFLRDRISSSMQMLVRNLAMGITGGILAAAGIYLLSLALDAAASLVYQGVDFLAAHRMAALLSILVEPAKVFFLNNIMNHAVLVPLGIAQVQEAGSSVLFLIESNPGPGIGVMAALYYVKKEKRDEYISAIIAEAVGGIHEVYFPFVLSNLRLIIPLILGGMAGNLCFGMLDAGLRGVVSPGSILIILLMAGKGKAISVTAGIVVSALVAFAGSLLILQKGEMKEEKVPEAEKMETETLKKIEHIAFVCDGGVGSSAMGAALFRRNLSRSGITGVKVDAYASDLIPEDVDFIVCQKDFFRLRSRELGEREVYTVESLVKTEEYGSLIEQIQKRNG